MVYLPFIEYNPCTDKLFSREADGSEMEWGKKFISSTKLRWSPGRNLRDDTSQSNDNADILDNDESTSS